MSDVCATLEHRQESYVLTLSWGQKPSSGYRIVIDRYTLEADALRVYYHTISPRPDALVLTVLTHPTAVVTLPNLPLGPTTKIVLICQNQSPTALSKTRKSEE